MELTTTCSQCDQPIHVGDLAHATVAACPRCATVKELRAPLEGRSDIEACPACATADLYVQKDFPHGLGLAIVFAGFAVSTVFWYYFMPGWALGVLLSTALLDGLLYRVVPNVTICYRCLSQIRGPGSNPDDRFKPFDLAIGERYRQERIRIEEMRKSQPAR